MPGVVRQFFWFMAACAAGLYVGATIAGLGGLVSGNLADTRVLYGTPFYLGIGALLGLWAARATGGWLLVELERRKARFAALCAVMMPFAVCAGQLPQDTVAAWVLLPGCVTGGLYLLLARRARRHAASGRVRSAEVARENERMLNEVLRDRVAQYQRENAKPRH